MKIKQLNWSVKTGYLDAIGYDYHYHIYKKEGEYRVYLEEYGGEERLYYRDKNLTSCIAWCEQYNAENVKNDYADIICWLEEVEE